MKFMVVDDASTMRRIVLNSLKSVGYADSVEASDGVEALKKWTPEIGFLITDWNMPNMGGLDLVKALRADPANAKVPILMVTTRGDKEDIMAAVEAGVSGYILKPFTPPVLKAKIDEILAKLS